MRSAVVLAGGEARRANGQEKYFFTYEGKTFIERLVGSLSGIVDEIVIVARDPVQCTRFKKISNVTCVSDIRQGLGPIGGLHAGSLVAGGDLFSFLPAICPASMPAWFRISSEQSVSTMLLYHGGTSRCSNRCMRCTGGLPSSRISKVTHPSRCVP